MGRKQIRRWGFDMYSLWIILGILFFLCFFTGHDWQTCLWSIWLYTINLHHSIMHHVIAIDRTIVCSEWKYLFYHNQQASFDCHNVGKHNVKIYNEQIRTIAESYGASMKSTGCACLRTCLVEFILWIIIGIQLTESIFSCVQVWLRCVYR